MRSTHLIKSSSWFWHLLSKSADLSKPWGRFFQILCVSQKVRTLMGHLYYCYEPHYCDWSSTYRGARYFDFGFIANKRYQFTANNLLKFSVQKIWHLLLEMGPKSICLLRLSHLYLPLVYGTKHGLSTDHLRAPTYYFFLST